MKNISSIKCPVLGAAVLLLAATLPAAAATGPVHRHELNRHEVPFAPLLPSGSLYPAPGANNDMNALVGPDGIPNPAGAQYERNVSHAKDCLETPNFPGCS